VSVTRVIRKARKAHRCDGCDRPGKIRPGDAYLSHTYLSGDDLYHDYSDRPQRFAECADCAGRYGRGELLNPVLEGQTVIDDALEGGDDAVHEAPVPN